VDVGSALKLGKKKEETEEDRELALERAHEVHDGSLVIDGHIGTLFDILNAKRRIDEDPSGHVNLSRLRQGGVRCAIMGAFPADREYPVRGVRSGLEYIDAFNSLGDIPGVRLALSANDIEEAARKDEIAVMLAFDGGEFLDGSVGSLRMFHRLGLRVLGLTWNERNLLADGAAESATKGGLTHFGAEVVSECAKLGIVVDASHLSEAAFYDLAERSEKPFVVSHANCHMLYAHPRNLTNDQLRVVRDTGGVVGISFNPAYLGTYDGSGLDRVCEHLEHAVEVAGEEHVALGTDFDAFSGPGPEPLDDSSKLGLLTERLLKRGMSGRVISGLLGGNWMRVLRAVI
jgi:membrane dipeptidase